MPPEASLEAIFEAREGASGACLEKNDLFVVVAQRIEEVEEFFLRFFRVGDELHVVHDEDVVLAVLVFEIVGVPARTALM
jgi:hypothetical protein